MTRQAAAYRDGRVLLAGDAAHVHSPVGGQGLNIGVQDAVNLGWKLAQVDKKTSPDSLLDTYHAERHPVAARVLRNTMAQTALRRPDDRTKALRDTVAELLSTEEPRERFAAMMAGLDVHYDLGEGHPLLGRRMPDLDLVTGDGPLRVFTLLHDARPVLLNLGEPGGFDITPWTDRVQLVDAQYDGAASARAASSAASSTGRSVVIASGPNPATRWSSAGSLTVPVVTLRPARRSTPTNPWESRKCSTQIPPTPCRRAQRASAVGACSAQATSRAGSPRAAAASHAAVWKLRTSTGPRRGGRSSRSHTASAVRRARPASACALTSSCSIVPAGTASSSSSSRSGRCSLGVPATSRRRPAAISAAVRSCAQPSSVVPSGR